MKQDVIQIEVLADGTIKTSTDKISAANHANAAQFLRDVAKLAGGTQTSTRKGFKPQETTHSQQNKASN